MKKKKLFLASGIIIILAASLLIFLFVINKPKYSTEKDQSAEQANEILSELWDNYVRVEELLLSPGQNIHTGETISDEEGQMYCVITEEGLDSVEDVKTMIGRVYSREYTEVIWSKYQNDEYFLFKEIEGRLCRICADGVLLYFSLPVDSAEILNEEEIRVEVTAGDVEEYKEIILLKKEDGIWKIDRRYAENPYREYP